MPDPTVMPTVVPLPQLVAGPPRPIAKMPIQAKSVSEKLPALVGPVMAVSNPEYFLKPPTCPKDADEAQLLRIKRAYEINCLKFCGVNFETARLNIEERQKRREERSRKYGQSPPADIEPLSSSSRLTPTATIGLQVTDVKPIFVTEPPLVLRSEPLKLNDRSIGDLLAPFNVMEYGEPNQKPLRLHGLTQYPGLKSYIVKESDNTSTDEEAESKARYENSHSMHAPYPLDSAQSQVIRLLRETRVIEFTDLPSSIFMMRLINLSELVTKPFHSFDSVLFPNVDTVIFSSKMQLSSLHDRRQIPSNSSPCGIPQRPRLPHPITFALQWLVGQFAICIHSPTLADKKSWIARRGREIRRTERGVKHEKKSINARAAKEWTDLNPLGGTIALDNLPNLTGVVYHNVLPGDRPIFRGDIDTTIYFGRYDEPQGETLGLETLRAISRIYIETTRFYYRLKLVNLEYLDHVTKRPAAPRISAQTNNRRIATMNELAKLIALGRGFEPLDCEMGSKQWAAIMDAFTLETDNKHHPEICDLCQSNCTDPVCEDEEIEDPDDIQMSE